MTTAAHEAAPTAQLTSNGSTSRPSNHKPWLTNPNAHCCLQLSTLDDFMSRRSAAASTPKKKRRDGEMARCRCLRVEGRELARCGHQHDARRSQRRERAVRAAVRWLFHRAETQTKRYGTWMDGEGPSAVTRASSPAPAGRITRSSKLDSLIRLGSRSSTPPWD